MTDRYDVIVVGARCAGAPTAMLLAQRGFRVLVIDPANRSSYAGHGGASGDSGGVGGQGGDGSVGLGGNGADGAYLQGGDGGTPGDGDIDVGGGGGGGGYAGGGGGGGGSMWTAYNGGGGGGGGSSYVNNAAATESGASATVTGDGSATITYAIRSVASLAPATKGFGSVTISHHSATQTFTLTNTSPDMAMTVGTATVAGADASAFPITSDSCSGQSLAAGGGCTVTAQFAPTGTGDQAATLSIPSDAGNGTATASLTGTGQNPQAVASLSPAGKGFGGVTIWHHSATQNFTLTNTSADTAITVGTATVTSADASAFPITSDSCSGHSLAAGAGCTVTAQFAPTGTGGQAATLSIPSDATNGTVTASLTGTGLNPPTAGVQDSQDFGVVATGSTMPESIVVQNLGDLPLTVGQAGIGGADAGQFALATDGCSGQRVAPGDICQVHVEFSPASLGAKQATLTLPSDDPNSPATVTLTGTGRAPATPPTEQQPPTEQPPTVTPPVSNPTPPPLVNSHTLTAHHPVTVTLTTTKPGKVTLTMTRKVHGRTRVIGTVTVTASKGGKVSYKLTTKFARHTLAKGAYTLTAKAPGEKMRSSKLNVR